MKHGLLKRSFILIDSQQRQTKIEILRFLSLAKKEIGAISYSVTPLNHDATITFIPYLDGDVTNEDSNYDEKFWMEVDSSISIKLGQLTMKTKKLDFISIIFLLIVWVKIAIFGKLY